MDEAFGETNTLLQEHPRIGTNLGLVHIYS